MIVEPMAALELAGTVLVAVALFGWMKYTFLLLAGFLLEAQPEGIIQQLETAFRLFPKALVLGLLGFVWLDIVKPIRAI